MKNNMALGLMSGTSADGLTISAVRLSPFCVVCFKNYTYPLSLQKEILSAAKLSAVQISALHFKLGKLYAQLTKKFLKEFNLSPKKINVIGSHGQTVFHGPNAKIPHTFQIGESAFLSAQLGIPVVSDFRVKDMALGGQGAPLIPFFDEYIWGKGKAKILLNIGGISNISVVGKNIKTYGFDVGAGNSLLDIACQKYFKKPFDKNGKIAAKGSPDKDRVYALLQHKFFRQKPPKSLDKNELGEDYLTRFFPKKDFKKTEDLIATLTFFTAAAIAEAVLNFVPKKYRTEIIVAGGGAFNATLMGMLCDLLPDVKIVSSSLYGIHPQAKESAAFALFAALALAGKKNHCPKATGAKKAAILGKISL